MVIYLSFSDRDSNMIFKSSFHSLREGSWMFAWKRHMQSIIMRSIYFIDLS